MLGDEVKKLEANYARLHWLAGNLIATLMLPRNQKHICEGKGLDELCRMIEMNHNQFRTLPEPQSPAGSAGTNGG